MGTAALIGAVAFAALGYWLHHRGHRIWLVFLCFIVVGLFIAGTQVGDALHSGSTKLVSSATDFVSGLGR